MLHFRSFSYLKKVFFFALALCAVCATRRVTMVTQPCRPEMIQMNLKRISHVKGSEVKSIVKEGNEIRWKLLAIIDDEIPPQEKMTRLWKEKKGKATSVDRILIIAPEGSNPKSCISDPKMVWNRFER